MWFSTLIVKNIIRRPLRSILTIIAIAIAIGSVVSLVGIASGFESTFRGIYERKGVDLIVVRAGASQRINSLLPESLGDKMRELPGVAEVIPGLVDMISLPNSTRVQSLFIQGWVPETPVFNHLKYIQGRPLSRYDEKAVLLGSILARNLEMGVGEKIEVYEGEIFEIVGIYETPAVFENGAMVLPLAQLQRMMDRKGKVTGFSVVLDAEMKKTNQNLIPEMRARIEALEKHVSAMPTKEHVGSLTEIQLVKAMAWLTSAIALAIGLFGVMNTMVMAVNERTKEIGILRAVGWRPNRVMRLVLFEAVLLSLMGAAIGVMGAVVLVQALTRFPMVSGLIDGRIAPIFYLYGFAIATIVGLLGGIIPARRAAGLLPTVALRQE
jgi:putative ABC transport system permease protein